MLKRRIFAASLASVLALSSFSVSAFAADEKNVAYASKSDLQNLVKTCDEFKDKELDQYGEISANKFENVLAYAKQVSNNSKATLDEIAVAFLMLTEAKNQLTIHTADELNTLLELYKDDYESENIINEELDDEIWFNEVEETSYDNFAYEYSQALNVDTSDSKAVSDAYENLKKARESLVENKSVTKRDFNASIVALENALKKEYDYNSWTRVTVKGMTTKPKSFYEGKTFGWSALFYHINAAYTEIVKEFNTIKENKSINYTTNGAIVRAKEACDVAVDVLTHIQPAKEKTYGTEDAVLNIVLKDYKNKIMVDEAECAFIEDTAKTDSNVDGLGVNYVSTTMFAGLTGVAWKDCAGAVPTAAELKKLYNEKTGKLELTLLNDGSTNQKVYWDAENTKFVTTQTSSEPLVFDASKNDAKVDIMDYVDLFAVLAGKATAITTVKQNSDSIYDGATGHKSSVASDKDVPNNSLCDFVSVDFDKDDYDAERDGEPVNYATSGDVSNFASSATALKDDAGDRKAATVDLKTVIKILQGGSTEFGATTTTETVKGYGKNESEDADAREAILADINDNGKVSMGTDKKIGRGEWSLIGSYLQQAMSYLFDETIETYTLAEYEKLIDQSEDILDKTSESYVFAAHHNALDTARKTAVGILNDYKKEGKKEVTKAEYKALKDAKDDLEDDLDAFSIGYDEIFDKIAEIAKSDVAATDENLYDKLLDCAYKLATVEELALTDGSFADSTESLIDDKFVDYNRVFTSDKKYGSYAASSGGANQSHYDLKTAYEALKTAYDALTSPTTTKGDGQKSRCATFP